jgi:flagellar biosynthesis chaperone FliJ
VRRAFSFRLARVQRVREAEERLARAAWGEAQAAASAAAERRALAARSLDTARAELVRIVEAGKLDPGLLGAAHAALASGVELLRRAHEEALTLTERAERFADVWRERERERRSLVRLDERSRARHRAELERADALEQDERALARAMAAADGRLITAGPEDRPVKAGAESADQR